MPVGLWIALGLVAAVAVALWIARRRGPAPAPPAIQGEVVEGESLAAAMNRIGQEIDSHSHAIGHPRDLLEDRSFQEAVRRLSDPATPIETVRQFAFGSNWAVAAAAFEALAQRKDAAGVLGRVMLQFKNVQAWTLHFALRYLDSLDDRPPAGATLAFLNDWTATVPAVVESYSESFARRAARGDPAEFGTALDEPGAASREVIEGLLRLIDHPFAEDLRLELERWAGSRVDHAFLTSFGRFWDGADEKLLVETEAWRPQLDAAEKAVLGERSVLVIGESRIGKTTFLRLLGARLARQGWRVFEAGAPELMAGQSYFGQLEGRIRQTVTELEAGKRVAWCVTDIVQLARSGTHQGQSASVLDQILPAVTAGKVVILAEASGEGAVRVLRARPALRSQIETHELAPFEPPAIRELAHEVARRLNALHGPQIEDAAIEAALQFSQQFFTNPSPGVVVDVLKRALQHAFASKGTAVTPQTVMAALSQITGLPEAMLDDRQRVDLAELRRFFTDRVMGQDEAVNAVVDRVAMLKAGLVDPNRPVGVFFFAGPTGTGKTELAKTLAEYLFGSSNRMARLDMSEFQTADSTVKILGERGGGETDSLIERVRKQPFSVVLLDEFEKAHANVWDLFLQVFDDGRLTDANGYAVDFRHTIIILTSNLGATSHRSAKIGFGSSADAYTEDQVLKAVGRTFRPEFVNRLDRVVVFQPLSRELMQSILKKELAQILERRGLRNRDWAVEWEPSALEFLLDRGFSPEMGARPLKRAIDQHLLAPLAATLVEHRFPEGGQFLFVRSNGKAIEVEFVDPDAEAAPAEPVETAAPTEASLASMILQPAGTMAEAAALAQRLAAIEAEMESESWRSLKASLTAQASSDEFWSSPERPRVFARLALMDRIREAASTADRLGQRMANAGHPSREMVGRLALQTWLVEQALEDLRTDAPIDAVLAVEPALDSGGDEAAHAAWCKRLAAMYRGWAERRHMQFEEIAPPRGKDGPTLLKVAGFGAHRLLAREAGLHVLENAAAKPARRVAARVRVAAGPAEEPRTRIHGVLCSLLDREKEAAAVARRYQEAPTPLVRDKAGWRSGKLDAVLAGDFDLIGEA